MAWRAIQDTCSASESLAQLSDFAERLYWRLLAQTDPWGRLPGAPRKVRALCVPLLPKATEARIQSALAELEQAGRLLRYQVNGKQFVELTDFDENQPRDAIGNSRGRFQSHFPAPGPGQARPSPPESESESENRSKAANAASSDVRRIFDDWVRIRGKDPSRTQLTEGRRTKIQARLRRFPAAELTRALAAVALDPWDDRPRHDDLTILLRSDEQVEKFLALADNPPSHTGRRMSREELEALADEVPIGEISL